MQEVIKICWITPNLAQTQVIWLLKELGVPEQPGWDYTLENLSPVCTGGGKL